MRQDADDPSGRAGRYARRVMEERARLLAARGRQDEGHAGVVRRPAVILEVGDQGYAIDLRHVLRMTEPAWSAMPMRPDCPAGVRGVYGYVGNLYTVFDLSVLLGGAMMQAPDHAPGAMVLLRPVAGLSVTRVAVLAERTTGVMDVTDISSAGGAAGPPAAHPMAALPDGRVVAALDPARLFATRHFGV
ncbi:chemotaxis protein CheW [Gluconacetobacter diazotrophicus]|uniref:Chemotaxis protein CheW n=1 Tax=Gluconacetobacter diazotrophicus TaxID=33996 RepID=A0A7W4FCW3_GLUDI|nr:chemotaxis protein CheW [Gluconacetobacter diazotrophicus]MBB2155455.1 chemotaxis protein CheW [Gluconacetobacter diazotrophicus]